MKSFFVPMIIVIIALIFVGAIAGGRRDGRRTGVFKKKRLLSDREQSMFYRLQSCLPDCVVLAQVSFGALLNTPKRADRNYFDRKIADFVVCNKALMPIAIIELDDASHKSKAESDEFRDSMLKQAGYRVLRYANIPDVEQVKRDFAPAAVATEGERRERIEPT